MAEPQDVLEIREGAQTRRVDLNGDRITFGRLPDCTVVLSDHLASRQHCVLERLGEQWALRDLNSSNGTKVNGQPVRARTLSAGDIVMIGSTTIVFRPSPAPEVDTLSADDLVEAHGGDRDVLAIGSDVDYEQGLASLAEALPAKAFGEHDIEMLNARGDTVHPALKQPRQQARRDAVDLLRLLLLVCFRSRTSDIHVEPRPEYFQVRLRIDGTMVDVARMPAPIGARVTTLVKVLGDIDIAQRNAIQEGHFTTRVPAGRGPASWRRVDYRVSFAPSVYGQKLVVRILDASSAPHRLGDLSLPKWMYDELAAAVQQDAGMVLVAGPTGSGKTTTLYALVRTLDLGRRNVMTIEDPVEIQIEGVTQIPVDEDQGKSFSALLRSLLRQDPDVILVGEVRDQETARIAMQAGITGHLVLSSIHTKDTVGTVFRLLDLGVEPYLVSQSLNVVVAQRLMRLLCPFCRKPQRPTAAQKALLDAAGATTDRVHVAGKCVRCLGTGFSGRRAVFELLRVNDELRDVIQRNPTQQQIQEALKGTRFFRLQDSAMHLVAEGVTSVSEVEKVCGLASTEA